MSLGWVYVGSANLSESAWGRIVKDRATGQPKMSCRNWESGVVVRVGNRKNSSTVSTDLNECTSASTKVKAAAETETETETESQAQARSSVQAGKTSRQPGKGRDTSQQVDVQKQKQPEQKEQQQQQHKDHLENTDVDMEMVLEGTVPIPMQQPGRRYREGEEPWFYSMQE
ncbi:hypothetical protein ACHAPD_000204 [Fusarium lateritium]